MRAAILESPQRLVMADLPAPDPGPGEVRVSLDGAGICASELPVWEGREWFQYPRPPGSPGHEAWGRVDALGAGVSDLQPGQRVALICERAHAEFDVAPAANVVSLPAAIPESEAFPGEPLACAVNAFRRSDVCPGQRVAILGAGFQGLLLVQLGTAAGAEVTVCSRRDSGLALARQLGAASAVTYEQLDPGRVEPFDVVFEATGHQGPLDLAGTLTRTRGRLVIVGYHQDGRRTVDMQLWNWRGLDVINAHEREPTVYAEGLREAVQAVQAGRLRPAPLLTHSFALEDLGAAYRTATERPDGFIKAVWRRD